MERAVPHAFIDHLFVAVVVLAIGAGVTYLEVAQPSINNLETYLGFGGNTATNPSPAPAPAPTPAQAQPIPTPQAASPAAAATTPAPTAVPAAKTAITVSFVHMRTGKSTGTPVVFDLDGGTTVTLRDDSDPTWQGVTYQGKDGYIYKTYLQY
jgi:hypothetical protein